MLISNLFISIHYLTALAWKANQGKEILFLSDGVNSQYFKAVGLYRFISSVLVSFFSFPFFFFAFRGKCSMCHNTLSLFAHTSRTGSGNHDPPFLQRELLFVFVLEMKVVVINFYWLALS